MNTQYKANSWILREFLASVKHLLAILCLLWQVQLQSREWWWGTPGHSSLLIQGRTARLGCFLTAWGHFLSRWFFPLWKSCFLVLLFIPLCHSPCPHSFLLLSLPRHSGCCYFLPLCLYSSSASFSLTVVKSSPPRILKHSTVFCLHVAFLFSYFFRENPYLDIGRQNTLWIHWSIIASAH